MAAFSALQAYGTDSSESENEETGEVKEGFMAHLKPIDKTNSVAATLALNLAPDVAVKVRARIVR